MSSDFEVADKALNSTAAKQLLIYNVNVESRIEFEQKPGGGEKNHVYIPTVDLSLHQRFQDSFDMLGPLEIPHFAISNGSRSFDQLNGTTDNSQTIQSNGKLLSMILSTQTVEWEPGDILPIRVVQTNFLHKPVSRFFPGAYETLTEVVVRVNGIRVIKTNQTPSETLTTHADFGLGAYDLAPACHADDGLGELVEASGSAFDLQYPSSGPILLTTLHADHFAFVPTSSALNLPISFSAPVSGCGPGITDCITPEATLINRGQFVEPTANHEHVTFTAQIATQLLDRIPDALASGLLVKILQL